MRRLSRSCARQRLPLKLVHVLDDLGDRGVLLRGNRLADFDAGIERPRKFFALENRNSVLLGQFADSLGEQIHSFSNHHRCGHFFVIVFKRHGVVR